MAERHDHVTLARRVESKMLLNQRASDKGCLRGICVAFLGFVVDSLMLGELTSVKPSYPIRRHFSAFTWVRKTWARPPKRCMRPEVVQTPLTVSEQQSIAFLVILGLTYWFHVWWLFTL
ncbi:hypothetical protein H4582DRAFT_2004694 [Lactarius indigo]|nr:hypothetical protein H4582DRAFT_2004694 [Lactarius indigo]